MSEQQGLCECGCGGLTKIATKTRPSRGWIKGKPKRFIEYHHLKHPTGPDCWNWNGGRKMHKDGYVLVASPGHPRADSQGYVRQHILACEKAIGKRLPNKSEPHHVNGKKNDNRPDNLVLCEDRGYHMLLHKRMRAYKACGHADWHKCRYCKEYDDPSAMKTEQRDGSRNNAFYHANCKAKYDHERVYGKPEVGA